MTRDQLIDLVREGLSHYPEYDGPNNERDEYVDTDDLLRPIVDFLRDYLETYDEEYAALLNRDPLPDMHEEEELTVAGLCEWLLHAAEFLLFLASRVPDSVQREVKEYRDTREWTPLYVPYDPMKPEGLREID